MCVRACRPFPESVYYCLHIQACVALYVAWTGGRFVFITSHLSTYFYGYSSQKHVRMNVNCLVFDFSRFRSFVPYFIQLVFFLIFKVYDPLASSSSSYVINCYSSKLILQTLWNWMHLYEKMSLPQIKILIFYILQCKIAQQGQNDCLLLWFYAGLPPKPWWHIPNQVFPTVPVVNKWPPP